MKNFIDNNFRIKQNRSYKQRIINLQNVLIDKEKRKNENKKEYNLITFDIETYGLNPNNLAFCSFYDGKKFYNFYDKKGILDFLDDIKTDTIIYGHNLSNFDINIFFEELISNDKWNIRKTGDILHFKYINENGKEIIFKDSYYILKGSLKNLSKDFLNEDNQKLQIDDKFINPNKFFDEKEYRKNPYLYNKKTITKEDIEYCNRDTKVLYDLLNLDIFKDLGFDFIRKNTIASISYERLLKNSELLFIDINKDREFVKLYSGGITEVYKHKNDDNTKVLCLDYNSFYPYSMTQSFGNLVKMKRHYQFNKDELKEFFEMLKEYPNGYSEVNIKLKDNLDKETVEMLKKLPLFPIKGLNYFNFCNGIDYQISIMNVELSNLVEYFEITPIYSLYCKKSDMYKPFKNYVEELYKLKEESSRKKENSKKFIYKLLLNSSYGRLGLKTQTDSFLIGSFDFIYKEINETLQKIIDKEIEDGYTYIFNLVEEKRKTIDKLLKLKDNNEIEEIEILKYLKSFIEEIKDNYNGYHIKHINKMTNEENENIYIVSYTTEKKESIQSSYYYASEITSKCRSMLVKDIIEISKSKLGKVCYTDTDSLHIETKNPNKLLEYLSNKNKIDSYEIGKLDNEGIYEKGIWLSKKHYYIFSKIDNKLVLKKQALKGFTPKKPIDYFVYKSPEVFVNKIYSRIIQINPNSNTLLDSKTFLNFTTNRDINNNLFSLEMLKNRGYLKNEKLKHSLYIKNLFFDILESGKYYIDDNGKIELVTKDKVENRIKELEEETKRDIEKGIYKKINEVSITNKSIDKKLKKMFRVKKNKVKVDTKIKKPKDILELVGIEM